MPQGVPKESSTCPKCGEDFLRLDSHFRGLTTCEPPPGFFGDEADADTDTYHTRHGSDFKEARKAALERSGYRCERCGMTNTEHKERDDLFGGGLHVHHKVDTTEYDDMSKAHDLSNLEVLCAECHGV
jgi:ribosomal protein S27AE